MGREFSKATALVVLFLLIAVQPYKLNVGAPVTGPVQLTFNSKGDFNPVISADGRKVAFSSGLNGDLEIAIMNSDGTGLLQLTSNSVNDTAPSISGDGGKVAFVSDRGADTDIWIVNSDGTGLSQLTQNNADDLQPSISSNGLIVAFASADNPFGLNPERDFEIFSMKTDRSGLTQLTRNGVTDGNPSVNADGTRISFESRIGGDYEIWIVNLDGSGLTQLTDNFADDTSPSISAAGGRITFQSLAPAVESVDPDPLAQRHTAESPLQTTPFQVYAVNSNGTGLKQLSSTGGDNVTPSISGDGTRVAYVSTGDGDREIYLVSSDGTGLTRVTNNTAFDAEPSLDFTGQIAVFMSNLDGDFEIFAAQILFACVLQGDVNQDGTVNFIDLGRVGAAFLTTIGNPGYDPEADLNKDGAVNFLDLGIVGANFLKSCNP